VKNDFILVPSDLDLRPLELKFASLVTSAPLNQRSVTFKTAVLGVSVLVQSLPLTHSKFQVKLPNNT